ncbi:MAG: hypothetical protein ACHQ53_11830, partial [Polyangiales bacterium]
MSVPIVSVAVLVAGQWWLGCNKSSAVPSSAAPTAAAPLAAPSASAEPALPPGHPAVGNQAGLPPGHPAVAASTGPAPGGADSSTPPSAGGLTWSAAAPLQRRAPKSSMRAAEYGVEGDPQAELSVFYFGAGQGGAVDANIARWLGQLSQPDGSDTTKKAKRGDKTIHGIAVTTIEASGAFSGGMGGSGPIEHATLLGA